MTTPAENTQPSPDLFFETVNGFQRSATMKAAVELDVFTAIGEGTATSEAVARRCKASERGIRILCDYLVVLGFLTKQGRQYALTPDSAMFLDRRSPAYLASAVNFLCSPMIMDGYRDFTETVRRGTTLTNAGTTLTPENPIWVEFARSMAPMMRPLAEPVAQLLGAASGAKWKVLDMAAGHGLFGIAVAKLNPHAEVIAVDWPNVLEVAKENARAAGVMPRYRTLAGSAFEVDFGTGFEIVLLTNFLHHFDPMTIENFLRKVHASLVPGGRAAALEFIPNEDRVSPPRAATFSVPMLASTPSGDAYTFSEYERMFGKAGFTAIELHALPPSPESIVIATR